MRINRESLAYRSAVLAASNILLQIMGFAYRIALSRLAGAEGMGVHALSMQVYSVLYSVCISGAAVAVTTLSARLYIKSGIHSVQRLMRFAATVFLIILAVMTCPVLMLREGIAVTLLGDGRASMALWLIPLCIMLTGLENVMKSALLGMGKVRRTAVSELVEQGIRFTLVILLLSNLSNGDYEYIAFLIVVGMTLSEIFSVSFLGISFFRFLKKEGKLSRPYASPIAKRFFDIALPSAMTSICATLLSSASTVIFPARLMVAGFSNSEAVSMLGVISGMAEPLMSLPMAFVGAMCTVLMPSISGRSEIGDINGVRRKSNKAIRVAALFSLATALMIPFASVLCEALFKQRITLLLAVMLGVKTVIGYFLVVTISILNGIYEHKRVLLNSIIGELLQLGLIWMLTAVPELNIYGYLAGMVVGDGLRLILNLRWVKKSLKN